MNENLVSVSEPADDWNGFDFGETKTERVAFARELNFAKYLRFAVVGAIAGVLIWLLTLALNAWIIRPVFCQNVDTASICASSNSLAFYISTAVIGLAAFMYFAKIGYKNVFLPTLATLVSLAAMWTFLGGAMIASFVILAIFGALFYLFFAKIASLRNYLLAFILSVAFVVLLWLLVSAR
jgi:hypothetical protein